MSTARLSTRLARLLNMVPYFQANPGLSAAEAAAELGVTTKQLMSDLNQLWMCGLPGYGPGDLIDLSFSEESIEVTFSAGMDRPLRLTATEAAALMVALHWLLELPGTVDPGAAAGALAKIETAAGIAGQVAGRRAADTPTGEPPAAAVVRSALANTRALRIVYYSAGRDAVSQRVVDPIRILVHDRQSYLEAWSRESEDTPGGIRLFRFDRIDEAVELAEPSRPPRPAEERSGFGLFDEDAELPVARLQLSPEWVWMAELYQMTEVLAQEDGNVQASMRYATTDWMVRMLLGCGGGVSVLSPPDLAAALPQRASAALAAYAELVD